MLFIPEVSLGIGGFQLDGYSLALVILSMFLVSKLLHYFKRRSFVVNSLDLTVISLFSFLFLIYLMQAYIGEKYHFEAHVLGITGREDDENLTFGSAYYISRDILDFQTIRIFLVALLGLCLYFYIKSLSLYERAIFMVRGISYCALFQVFYLIIYVTGLSGFFVNTFMGGGSELFRDHVTYRAGFIRVPGGFSEPSFMTSLIFVFMCSILILSMNGVELSRKLRLRLALMVLIIFLTTGSMMMVFNLVFFIVFFVVFNKPTKLMIQGLIAVLWLSATTLQFASLYIGFADIPDDLLSVGVRQLLVSDLTELTLTSKIIGYGLGQVYNFPFLNNLVIQVGVVGALGIVLSFLVIKKRVVLSLGVFILFLSVVPSFGYSFIYIVLAIIFACFPCNLVDEIKYR